MPTPCNGGNFAGNRVLVTYAVGLGSDDPTSLTYLPFGSVVDKSWSITTTQSDNTADDTGSVNSRLVTGLEFEVSVSGFAQESDTIKGNQQALTTFYIAKLMAAECPNVWIRIVSPDGTIHAYCQADSKNFNASAPKETSGFDMSFVLVSNHDESPELIYTPTPIPGP